MRVFGFVAAVTTATVLAVAVFTMLLPLVLIAVVVALVLILRGMLRRSHDDPRRADFDAVA